jgi:hypothetical protein
LQGEPGERGADVDMARVAEMVAERARELLPQMLPELLRKTVDEAFEALMPMLVAKAAEKVPAGRDGLPGAPGRPGTPGEDGLSIEHFDVEMKDDRTVVFSLRAGDRLQTRELKLAGLPLYRGVWKSGQAGAKAGDSYTWGGSMWMAKRDTNTSPPGDDWQLVVKGSR